MSSRPNAPVMNQRITAPLSTPGVDRWVNLLRVRHRRQILLELSAGQECHETDLVMRGNEESEVTSDLTETHLPMLEEEGIIEWDRETGTISKGPNFEEIEPLLRLMREHADDLPPDWP